MTGNYVTRQVGDPGLWARVAKRPPPPMIKRLARPAHAAILREQARRLEQEAAALLRLADEIERETGEDPALPELD